MARKKDWEYHRGNDYAVVMLPGENTETASISIHSAAPDQLGALLCSAPRLLADLVAAYDELRRHKDGVEPPRYRNARTIKLLRAAIARATGDTPR